MSVNTENTYWNSKGKHEAEGKKLDAMIPASGSVDDTEVNAALETYRVARNCYHDLYNNGLMNRGQEFTDVFDINADEWTGWGSGETEDLQEFIDRTETRMDEIILAAYAEQFPEPCVGFRIRSIDDIASEAAAFAMSQRPAQPTESRLDKAIKLLSRVPSECILTPQIEQEIAEFLSLK